MGQNIDRCTSLRHWTKGVQFVLYTLFEMIAIGHVKSHMHDYYKCQTINFLFGYVGIDMSSCLEVFTLCPNFYSIYVHAWVVGTYVHTCTHA